MNKVVALAVGVSIAAALLVAVIGCRAGAGGGGGGCSMGPTKMSPDSSTSGRAATMPAATGYTCSMHPEVVSDKPGNCPKCGMALVPKQ